MIDQAMIIVREGLRQFLRLKLNLDQVTEKVVLTSIINQQGEMTIPNNALGITLYRVVEDRVSETEYRTSFQDSSSSNKRPPVILSLEFIITANFTEYTEGLKYLSAAIAFFQSQNYFDQTSNPLMPKEMAPFSVALLTQDTSEHNHTWSLFGSRYMPSVIYRLRSVPIQEDSITSIDDIVEQVDIQVLNQQGNIS
ncbi:DUF4255 domain-containing protein [Celerinatantimonas diazotrophica]|uniref:Uncharacterized protein DUF4255 n=1 Tax=Celerinatantimonas diazotrophica TaxID=412034 RepID=A0A4R1J9S4_9GAMM|nr:DUF4255 domain-containing protein [Celerinatantimonas diazotrophica]TCK47376.1 uncharacterized protein DUF4255 [Celerinatantimonas diazotrophica]CAG9295006.1 hypothetical protein CEDIAZO_00112 [Celerinatantimonas diazotrophica]